MQQGAKLCRIRAAARLPWRQLAEPRPERRRRTPGLRHGSAAKLPPLLGDGSFCLGYGGWNRYRTRILVGGVGRFLFPLRLFFLAQLICLGVVHVLELLHSAGEDLRSEDPVV